MTDRVFALTVALERDTRTDDVQGLIDAIKLLRGVLSVQAEISDLSQWTADERAKREYTDKLWAVLYPDLPR
jgi:hypothetical protein